MSTELIIILTVGMASFVRGVTGFGAALIAMPTISGLTGIYTAAPLMAIIGLTNDTLLCLYYRRSFDWGIVAHLCIGSALGIPAGFLILRFFPGDSMLSALGIMIATYAIYALFDPAMPALKSRQWTYGTGFLCGALGSSYNLPGPPVILYGNSQRWSQAKFKSNLSIFFLGNAVLVMLSHVVQDRFSSAILHQYAMAVPSVAIGLFAGVTLSKFFNPVLFRKVVLVLLVVIGIQLFFLGKQRQFGIQAAEKRGGTYAGDHITQVALLLTLLSALTIKSCQES